MNTSVIVCCIIALSLLTAHETKPGGGGQAMHLDGALRIWGNPGAEVVLDGITVDNEGWQWVPLQKEEQVRTHV
jgi:hypothetical protein